MHITRRRFSKIAITTVGLGAVGFPAFPEGSPPSDSQGTPKTKTKTGGATTTRKKPVKCCIDNKKLNALKRKIREIARHHNRLARRNMELRKLAEQAIPEIDAQVGKAAGLTPNQITGSSAVSAGIAKFLRRGRDFSDDINLVGNRLSKAELNCEIAAKTDNCSQRKRRMRNALNELTKAAKDLEKISGLVVRFSMIELGRLPKALTNRLRKTKRFLFLADNESDFWQNSVKDAKRQQTTMKAFTSQMLADC